MGEWGGEAPRKATERINTWAAPILDFLNLCDCILIPNYTGAAAGDLICFYCAAKASQLEIELVFDTLPKLPSWRLNLCSKRCQSFTAGDLTGPRYAAIVWVWFWIALLDPLCPNWTVLRLEYGFSSFSYSGSPRILRQKSQKKPIPT